MSCSAYYSTSGKVMPINRSRSVLVTENREVFVGGSIPVGNQEEETRTQPLTQVGMQVKVICADTSDTHTMIVGEDGSLWGLGANDQGQLGVGQHISCAHLPTLVELQEPIISVTVGELSSYAISSSRQVWSCGTGGRLGLGDYENRYIPCLINSLNNVVMVSAGVRHVLVLDSDGRVLSFGSGGYGTLGVREEYSNIPILVEIPSVRSISSGNFHNLFVTHSDGLWCCGNNCQGQLGIGRKSFDAVYPRKVPGWDSDNIVKVIAAGQSSFIKDIEGNVWFSGTSIVSSIPSFSSSFSIIHEMHNLDVFLGGHHGFAVDSEGNLYSFGYNNFGQCGRPPCATANLPLDRLLSIRWKKTLHAKSARSIESVE